VAGRIEVEAAEGAAGRAAGRAGAAGAGRGAAGGAVEVGPVLRGGLAGAVGFGGLFVGIDAFIDRMSSYRVTRRCSASALARRSLNQLRIGTIATAAATIPTIPPAV
jgi:hypothetical protein